MTTATDNELLVDDKSVLMIEKGKSFDCYISTTVRDLGDCLSLTLMRSYRDENGRVEDFGCDEYGHLFVSREHARAFAHRILDQLDGVDIL